MGILAEEIDEQASWKNAVTNATEYLQENPDDVNMRFARSVAYYHTGDYQKAVEDYEAIRDKLPSRALWYQIEPILAYEALENYDEVFRITDYILSNQNRAFSELYVIRGNVNKKQENIEAARNEYEKAIFYNVNNRKATEALSALL